jgi:hypothetical protein
MNVETQYKDADLLNRKRSITVLTAIAIEHERISAVP